MYTYTYTQFQKISCAVFIYRISCIFSLFYDYDDSSDFIIFLNKLHAKVSVVIETYIFTFVDALIF